MQQAALGHGVCMCAFFFAQSRFSGKLTPHCDEHFLYTPEHIHCSFRVCSAMYSNRIFDVKCAIHFFINPLWTTAAWMVNMLFQVVLQGISECENWVCSISVNVVTLGLMVTAYVQ